MMKSGWYYGIIDFDWFDMFVLGREKIFVVKMNLFEEW